MDKRYLLLVLVLNILVSLSVSAVVYSKLNNEEPAQNFVADFYEIENAIHISPHGLRKAMDKGDMPFTLVDLRSAQEYEKEHIIGAVNIPAYSDPDTSAYDQVDRIVESFKNLPKDKDVVVYCYSTACMTGRKVGLMLVKHGVYVKHLGIGWNEWRYNWNGWNHEHEWNQTDVKNYISTGREPGQPKKAGNLLLTPCDKDNTFGC